MLRRMELKNYNRKTIKVLLNYMKDLVHFYGKSPDELSNEELGKYLPLC